MAMKDDQGINLADLSQGERAWFNSPQDKCPRCGTLEIQCHGAAAPKDMVEITCDSCGLQWVEPEEELP